MKGIRVELTWQEMFVACTVGVMRRLTSMRDKGITNKRFSGQSDWAVDIVGAIAEACFASFKGIYWSAPIRTFKLPDVGTWQVRGTEWLDGHLIIRPKDKGRTDVTALVALEGFGGWIVGWIETEKATQEKYWRIDSWWVPQEDLEPFEDLRPPIVLVAS
jgi:hypothetical protein